MLLPAPPAPPATPPPPFMPGDLPGDSHGRPGGGPLARAVLDADLLSRPLHVAITTLLEAPPGFVSPYEGGMVQWCQNAGRLARTLPRHWRVAQLVLSGDETLVARLAASAECTSLERIAVDETLRRLAMECVSWPLMTTDGH